MDAHRHSWEGQLRRIIPDGAIGAYMATTHHGFAPYYRPHDHYVGNLITALGCIDAGITCVIDNSHNSRSAAHSDAAVQALIDSGIRGVHASGAPQTGDWDKQWPQDLARLQKQFFVSDDQLVTLRMFSGMNRENWALARQLGSGSRPSRPARARTSRSSGTRSSSARTPHSTIARTGPTPFGSASAIRAARSTSARVRPAVRVGEGIPALQKALDHGMRPGFSIDNEMSYGTDMFTEMRVAFHIQRAMATYRRPTATRTRRP